MSDFIKLGERTPKQITRMTRMGMRVFTEGPVVWVHKDDKWRLGGRVKAQREPLSEVVFLKVTDRQLDDIKLKAQHLGVPTTTAIRALAMGGLEEPRGPHPRAINARFTPSQKKRLQAEADRHGIPLSRMIRQLVLKGLE